MTEEAGSSDALREEIAGLRRRIRELEAAGPESEKTGQRIFRKLRDAYYRADLQGRLTHASPSAEELFGYKVEEARGMDLAKEFYLYPEERQRFLRLMKAQGYVKEFEAQIRRRDGSVIWTSTNATFCTDEDGKIVGIEGFSRDVTDRKRAEEALRRSEERFRELAEMLPEIVFETDERGMATFANRQAFRTTGYTQQDIDAGFPAENLFVSADQDRLRQNMSSIMKGEDLGINEYTVQRRDGTTFPVMARSAPIVRDGEVVGLRGMLMDITDRKRAEEALRESEEFYRTLMDALPEAVVKVDLEGRILFASPRAAEIYGFDAAEELVGIDGVELVAPEDREKAAGGIQRALQKGASRGVEYALRRTDGSRFPAEVSTALIRDACGEPKAFVVIAHDITERKRAEEALRDAEGKRTELALEVAALRTEVQARHGLDSILGQNPKMQAVFETILAVSRTHATVLVQGETGTGKELVAKAVHYNSTRRDLPFVKVDCGALAENLLESELFGHVKGAFTGAVTGRRGRFELAADGTIFLDEIHNLSIPLQAKLLRVVQEGRFEKVGGTETQNVNVRIVAATNEDLGARVARGLFRKDLFYRLNVIPIHLPPLRERRGDIPLLARSFIERFAERHGKAVANISRKALERLMQYAWPGNVRELENIVEQAVVFCSGRAIREEDIRLPQAAPSASEGAAPPQGSLRQALEDPERRILLEALERAGGNKRRAAQMLGISRSTLYDKLKKHAVPQGHGAP